MNEDDKFRDFLDDLTDNDSAANKEVEERRERWIKSVCALFDDIRGWLRQPIDDKLIHYDLNKTNLSEDYVGTYDIATLTLKLGNQFIQFRPGLSKTGF